MGNYNLEELFESEMIVGGIFIIIMLDVEILVGNYFFYLGFGCVDVIYILENFGNCSGVGEVLMVDVMIFFLEMFIFSFFIIFFISCWDGIIDLVVEVDFMEFSYMGDLS